MNQNREHQHQLQLMRAPSLHNHEYLWQRQHKGAWKHLKAQEDEPIKTQEVLVVKSYTPSLSDAFKISEGPQVPDSLKAELKILNYKLK